MTGGGWRSQLFWSAFVILYVIVGIRYAFELLLPILPFLCPLVIVAVVGWLYIRWRNNEWS